MTNPYPVPINLPTNQKFGFFFAIFFAGVAAYAHWKDWYTVLLVALIASTFFVFSAFFNPQILAPLNQLWYKFGVLLGKIVSPIVLGAIFFLLITPISLVTRLFGRDELKIKRRIVQSYWVMRLPPGPSANSFKNQY